MPRLLLSPSVVPMIDVIIAAAAQPHTAFALPPVLACWRQLVNVSLGAQCRWALSVVSLSLLDHKHVSHSLGRLLRVVFHLSPRVAQHHGL